MTLDEFLEHLEDVSKSGKGYVARCPAHDDQTASLGITEGDAGILLNCYAGCATANVIAALGLDWSDIGKHGRKSYGEPEAIYEYTDEDGNLLFEAIRFPGKRFRQRHTDPETGEEVWSLDGVRRVLYRLPEVIQGVQQGHVIVVCEGEKDVEALRAAGQVATCNPMGAGKWRDEYTEALRGAHVVIVADRDEPGRNHANKVKDSLEGVAAEIHVVQAAKGKDAYDHLVVHELPVQAFVAVKQKKVRRGIITSLELAEQGAEDLNLTVSDIPGYQLCDAVPLVFRQGRMYAVGAYQGDGKSRFGLQGTRKLAGEGKRGAYWSLEMPERDVRNALLTHKGIPLGLLEEPWRLKGSEHYQTYLDGLEEIKGWNVDFICKSIVTAEEIADTAIEREHEFVIVDHVHRLPAKDRNHLEQQVKTLTNIALDQNLMLVMLCQLRKQMRGKDMAAYPIPTLTDFRETSQIADDASMALAIWRQRDDAGLQYTGTTQVIVLKNRHTTGRDDRAGHFFFPHFDPVRQMLVPAPVAA